MSTLSAAEKPDILVRLISKVVLADMPNRRFAKVQFVQCRSLGRIRSCWQAPVAPQRCQTAWGRAWELGPFSSMPEA